MEDKILLGLLESILGKSKPTSKGNHAFHCPFCHHRKLKLEINTITNDKKENPWQCWTCLNRGKTIFSLFTKLKVDKTKINQLGSLIIPQKQTEYKTEKLKLPLEFIPLNDISALSKLEQIQAKHALYFLKERNINENHIKKYNIGFCIHGKYSNRIIIPSYDENGELNYFIARDIDMEAYSKYKNPPNSDKNVIGLEYFINWEAPIILVEGMFDALTIQRNTIPLFGKSISEKLMEKLVTSEVEKIYIALDNDAQKEAIKHCQTLMDYNKEIYLIDIKGGKDISEIGFLNFLNILENTPQLTFDKIVSLKLNIQ